MPAVQVDPERLRELTLREETALAEKLPRSIEYAKTASQSLAGGVACSWHALSPATIYGDRGRAQL